MIPKNVEELTINGTTYFSSKELDDRIKKAVDEITKKPTDTGKPSFALDNHGDLQTDAPNVIGLGSATLKGEWHSVRLNVEYLKQVINVLEAAGKLGGGFTSVDIVMANAEFPVIFGRVDKNGRATGFILAPRVEN